MGAKFSRLRIMPLLFWEIFIGTVQNPLMTVSVASKVISGSHSFDSQPIFCSDFKMISDSDTG